LISAGEREFVEQKRIIDPFKRGLTVAVALDGQMSCRIDDRETIPVVAPSVSLILNGSQHRREQIFHAGQRYRYTMVHLSPRIVESHIGVPFDVLLEMTKQRDSGHDPCFISQPADTTIRSLASQIMVCPIQGSMRSLFLIGKGLELAACAIEQCSVAPCPSKVNALSSKTIDRVTAARDLLVAHYNHPAVLKRLASHVGMNERTLNVGFRQLFGTTPSDYLQEHRLQLAYRLIVGGEITISEAAYKVGYTPAYFSTLFRRRFGVAPRDLQS